MTKRSNVNPITFEVIRNSLLTTTEEMKSVVTRTAISLLIKNAGDLSCGILNTDLELVAQGEGDIPILLATMPYSLEGALQKIPADELKPGDALIHNDPYLGNNHLPDVFIVKPVFYDGEIIAYSAVKGHWADVGGATPGGVSASAREIFAEGIRIPPLKILERGKLNEDVVRFILSNTRMPSYVIGDLKAELAACAKGEANILALAKKYGIKTLKGSMNEMLNHSEELTRAGIREVRNGTYDFTDYLDGDGVTDFPIKIKVRVKVVDSDCYIDFEGTDRQSKGSMNVPYAATLGACFYAIKCITDPSSPANSGCYRPIHVNAPEGTVAHPLPPAGVGAGSTDTSTRIAECVFGALAKPEPSKVVAAGSGCTFSAHFSGIDVRHARAGRSFVGSLGGLDSALGAGSYHDGRHGTRSNVGNTGDIPIEVFEYYVPVLAGCYELIADSGGPGKFRGGLGLHRTWIALSDMSCSISAERTKFSPYGLWGGRPGRKARASLESRSGKTMKVPLKSQVFAFHKGDVLDLSSAGGGGYGDPAERNRELIIRDVQYGYVSREAINRDYRKRT